MAAKTVTIEEARDRLGELIDKASAGGEVILAKGGEPVAKIVALPPSRNEKRVFGEHRGCTRMTEDFVEPLPRDFCNPTIRS